MTAEERQALKRLVSDARARLAADPLPDGTCQWCGEDLPKVLHARPDRRFCSTNHRNRWWEAFTPKGQEYYRRKVNAIAARRKRERAEARLAHSA